MTKEIRSTKSQNPKYCCNPSRKVIQTEKERTTKYTKYLARHSRNQKLKKPLAETQRPQRKLQVPSLCGLCDSARGKSDNHSQKLAHAAQTFTVSNTKERRFARTSALVLRPKSSGPIHSFLSCISSFSWFFFEWFFSLRK